MCLRACDPVSARRNSARLIGLFVALLSLSVAIPSIADHLHLTAHGVNILDFVRGFLIGLAIALLAAVALLIRRSRMRWDSTSETR